MRFKLFPWDLKILLNTICDLVFVLVIDLPSRDYLADLERNELLNGHIEEINSRLGMEFVAHFTSSDIIEAPEYQKFMRRMNVKRHLALNETNL